MPEKIGDSMNKKNMYIIVAVLVIVIIIAGVAAYVFLNNGGGGTTNPTTTPSPTPAPSVVDASTLQFKVNETTNGQLVSYAFAGKNVNTTSEVLRMDILGGSAGNYSYIINLGTQKSDLKINDGAWASSDFNTDSSYIVAFADYQTALINWTGQQSYSYTAPSGASIVIFDIQVNPTLNDSLFATS